MGLMIAVSTICLAIPLPLAAGQPANQWVQLSDGAFKLPATGYPSLNGGRFLWLADRDCGLVAPLLTEHSQDYGVWTITHQEPAWKFTPSTLPEGRWPDLWESQFGYVYLPTLRKVLVVRQQWAHRSKVPTAGWLLDPDTAGWQPVESNLSMSDRSKDFNPSAGRDGLRLPIWCGAAYDPVNKEAVVFGAAARGAGSERGREDQSRRVVL